MHKYRKELGNMSDLEKAIEALEFLEEPEGYGPYSHEFTVYTAKSPRQYVREFLESLAR